MLKSHVPHNKTISISSEEELNKTINLCCTDDENETEKGTSNDRNTKVLPVEDGIVNIDPLHQHRSVNTLEIRSIEIPSTRIRLVKTPVVPSKNVEMAAKSKDNTDSCNVQNVSAVSMDNDFGSVFPDKLKSTTSVNDCYTSSPKVGVCKGTFGSIDVTRILQNFMDSTINQNRNVESERSTRNFLHRHHSPFRITAEETGDGANDSNLLSIVTTLNESLRTPGVGDQEITEKLLRTMSREFAECPRRFTDKFLSIIEESFLNSSRAKDNSCLNLSRITEEFRKLCKLSSIENVTMGNDSWMIDENTAFGVSTPVLDSRKPPTSEGIYPESVFEEHAGTCSTPKGKSPLQRSFKTEEDNSFLGDSTKSFTYLENECNEMYQDDRESPEIPEELRRMEDSHISTLENIMKICDLQLALLDKSIEDVGEAQTTTGLQPSLEISLEEKNSMVETVQESSYETLLKMYECDLEQELAVKRQRCLDTAKKMFEIRSDPVVTNAVKTLEKYPELIAQNETLCPNDKDLAFLSTLSACAQYHEFIASKRSQLESIQASSSQFDTDNSKNKNWETVQNLGSADFVIEKSSPKFNSEIHINISSESRVSETPVKSKSLDINYRGAAITETPSASSGKSTRKILLNKDSRMKKVKSTPRYRTSVTLSINPFNTFKKISPRSARLLKSSKEKSGNSKFGCVGTSKTLSSGRSLRKSRICNSSSGVTPSKVTTIKKMFSEKTMRISSQSPVRSVVIGRTLSDGTPTKSTTVSSLDVVEPNRSNTPVSQVRSSSQGYSDIAKSSLTNANIEEPSKNQTMKSPVPTTVAGGLKFFFTPGRTPTYGKIKKKPTTFFHDSGLSPQGKEEKKFLKVPDAETREVKKSSETTPEGAPQKTMDRHAGCYRNNSLPFTNESPQSSVTKESLSDSPDVCTN